MKTLVNWSFTTKSRQGLLKETKILFKLSDTTYHQYIFTYSIEMLEDTGFTLQFSISIMQKIRKYINKLPE